MVNLKQYWILGAVLLTLPAFLGGLGCSTRGASSGVSTAESETTESLILAFQRQHSYFETLIEISRRDRHFPAAVLAEAHEVAHAARVLFRDHEYELALELIEEAIVLLEGTQ
jgi:hypothetical protein